VMSWFIGVESETVDGDAEKSEYSFENREGKKGEKQDE
jgi:hypothetical protein